MIRIPNEPSPILGKVIQAGRGQGITLILDLIYYINSYLQVSWHVPNDDEITFVLDVFRTIVEPTLDLLYSLLQEGNVSYLTLLI
jgi:hypothetical protein